MRLPSIKYQTTYTSPTGDLTISATSQHTSQAVLRQQAPSTVFPIFHSSLSYTLVQDFAYPPDNPLFYGPLPEQSSEALTPASEYHRRLSDPPPRWDKQQGQWSAPPWIASTGEQLPPTYFGDGPPYAEDEDIHSPVVTSAKHKKQKSNYVSFDSARGRTREFHEGGRRGSYAGTNGDGSRIFYDEGPDDVAGGPGGEYITYDAEPAPHSLQPPSETDPKRDSHFATTLPNRSYPQPHHQQNHTHALHSSNSPSPSPTSSEASDDDPDLTSPTALHPPSALHASRFSRDYQFTIASPDEEMHGKAVALYDFTRENENELPLIEGQVILVSYRHGQGWLVAQDPRTGESGLVPEEYVRLLRDIEGGWGGWAGVGGEGEVGDGEYYTPVVSSFSTSSRDLEPWAGVGKQVVPGEGDAVPRDGEEEGKEKAEGTEENRTGRRAGGEQQEEQHARQAKRRTESQKDG
ncbi:HOG (high osmolarity glycerol) pathway protein [Coniosporium apollinis]|uniref:HOG (High osmolarity glycerol) pathway protein n=1 Tax=Coniosporium apollinis TaxID=61459 RepID=A0ABQ9P0B1_9PEZI|nr:HOG (high osmolarity glycerol) pathway protein [Coniosporium apollinis]